MKNNLKLWGVLLMTAMLYACGGGTSGKQQAEGSVSSETPKQEEVKSNWRYEEKTDEMTDQKIYFATCVSTNKEEFEFPYNGGSTLSIIIRNTGNQNEVIFYLSKGIMNASMGMGNEYIQIRFDNAKAEKYVYASSANGSLEYAFPSHSQDIINKLKSAKTVKVEVPVFNTARTIFNFNTEGLIWEHK